MKTALLPLPKRMADAHGTAEVRVFAAPVPQVLPLRDDLPLFRRGKPTVWLPVALLLVLVPGGQLRIRPVQFSLS